MSDNDFVEVVKKSFSKSDVCRAFKLPINGAKLAFVSKNILRLKLDISHFCPNGAKKNTKHELIEKPCPICKSLFLTRRGAKSEKQTCSHSCSNKLLNRGGALRLSNYRTVCFKTHGKKCAVCDEIKIVEVHHYDGNHNNDKPENLIPVCPTHHQYIHSQYKDEVLPKIDLYVKSRNVA